MAINSIKSAPDREVFELAAKKIFAAMANKMLMSPLVKTPISGIQATVLKNIRSGFSNLTIGNFLALSKAAYGKVPFGLDPTDEFIKSQIAQLGMIGDFPWTGDLMNQLFDIETVLPPRIFTLHGLYSQRIKYLRVFIGKVKGKKYTMQDMENESGVPADTISELERVVGRNVRMVQLAKFYLLAARYNIGFTLDPPDNLFA